MKTRRRVANPWDVWVYMSADYAGIEMVTLAQVCHSLGIDTPLIAALNAGQDIHARLAARVKGCSYEEIIALKKARDPATLDLRQSMKPVNYGKAGLMGAPKMVFTARKDGVYFCELADGWKGAPGEGCPQHPRKVQWGKRSKYAIPPTCSRCLDLATLYGEAWYDEWQTRDYHRITVEAARECERGVPLDSFGTGLLRMETSANAASNHFFQNLAAQGAKHAAYLLCRESYARPESVLYNNSRLVVFVHDEAFCEQRELVAHECAWRAVDLMKAGMKRFVPDVRVDIEPALMRRWFKGAEAVTGKDGRLKPWWPVDPKCRAQWPRHAFEDCRCWRWGPDQSLMAEDIAQWA